MLTGAGVDVFERMPTPERLGMAEPDCWKKEAAADRAIADKLLAPGQRCDEALRQGRSSRRPRNGAGEVEKPENDQ
jgi:hypothetical protein